MANWLLKTEPGDYSFDDLERDGSTVWDGVRNNLALKHLRRVKKGDRALVYHTGKERRVIGAARVASDPYPDPVADDDRFAVFDLEVGKRLPRPVTLAEIKADPAFEGFDLVRIPRLSLMPVSAAQWKRIAALARS